MPQIERKARNQALFRQVNERIAEEASRWDVQSETQIFVCECSHMGCTEQIALPVLAYERVRKDPTTFLVRRGHEDLEHERVLADQGDYLIVRNKPTSRLQSSAKPPNGGLRTRRLEGPA